MTDTLEATHSAADAQVAQPAQSAGALVESRQAPAPVAGIDDPIMAIIRDPSIDIERVRAFLSLRKEMADEEERKRKEAIAEQARREFNAALLACKKEIPIVIKNAKNTETHSQYSTHDQIGEAIDHIVAKHGFTASFYPIPSTKDGFVKVECLLAHSGGHERRFEAELPFDIAGPKGGATKTQIHGWKSATTYARKTLTEMIFDIKSKDDDGNAAGKSKGVISDEQVAELRGLIIEAAPSADDVTAFTEYLLGYVKANSLEVMTAQQFAKAKKGCSDQIAENKQAGGAKKGRAA